jgi:Methyltransferase domain
MTAQTPNKTLKMNEQVLLTEEQNATFDSEYHSPPELANKFETLAKHFGNKPISALDVGGGNGIFSDSFLKRFENSDSLVVDISDHLLAKNVPHTRKRILRASILDLQNIEPDKKYDVIFLNWILHHLVGETYQSSIDNINECLKLIATRLAPDGLICIGENDYSGYLDLDLPSRLIFMVTAVRNPVVSALVRRHANTAGTGVCFLSRSSWKRQFSKHNLSFAHASYEGPNFRLQGWKKNGLFIKDARKIHFYLKSA